MVARLDRLRHDQEVGGIEIIPQFTHRSVNKCQCPIGRRGLSTHCRASSNNQKARLRNPVTRMPDSLAHSFVCPKLYPLRGDQGGNTQVTNLWLNVGGNVNF